eukprot:s1529_g10.t1
MWSRLQGALRPPALVAAAAVLPGLLPDGSSSGSWHARQKRQLVSCQTTKAEATEREIAESFMRAAAMSALAGIRLQHGGRMTYVPTNRTFTWNCSRRRESPFGAAVVRDGVIISCAHNMVLHRGDPCCHAEMNAIQQACQALGSHDLSECELFTTCEPCPMCWGAVQWSRLGRAYIGVDRHTAAKYGFDDKVFYDEIDSKAGHYGIKRTPLVTIASLEKGANHRYTDRKTAGTVA